ncbi:MAG TPA: dephospho-CoA kinase [Crenotrichaceae bacterium]|nr:dephospho-CoA kinase [Crenotrichaceae bacterium]
MLKIGMTGGAGSGKTTVASLFQAYQVAIIDTDHLARKIRQPGAPAFQMIVEYFGPQCLDADGFLNSRWLRERIFKSVPDKHALEAITHPLIFQALSDWFEQQSGPYCIAIVPLLYETDSRSLFDRVLVVDCPTELQVKRISMRDNLSEKEAMRILSNQTSRENRLQLADDVIVNQQESISTLVKDVKKLHNLYLSISQTSD